jgi:HK97 family phage portal protein
MFGQLLKRADPLIPPNVSITDWAKMFKPGGQVAFGGSRYQAFQMAQASAAGGYYDCNSVVFAVTTNRILLFSEARFQFQRLRGGKPGDLFGTPALASLEEPWLGANTRDLLSQAELDVACHGNSYWVRDDNYPEYFLRLDPANVYIITERSTDAVYGATVGDRVSAYAYKTASGRAVIYEPQNVAHYKPHPSTSNRFLGTSWLAACISDIDADEAITQHKQSALGKGGSIPYVVTMSPDTDPEQFDEFVARFRESHEGAENSGKTLFLGGGADIKTVGQSFQELSMKAVQGQGETRIAAAAGIPPVIVGLSEGLAAATYSNYGQARRRLVDGTMRPLWGAFAAAFESLVPPPSGSRLWYDDRDIPFLREDIQDQATVKQTEAATIKSLIDAGFDPDTVVDAVMSADYARLVHSGLYSVQLQPPMPETPALSPSQPAALNAGR